MAKTENSQMGGTDGSKVGNISSYSILNLLSEENYTLILKK